LDGISSVTREFGGWFFFNNWSPHVGVHHVVLELVRPVVPVGSVEERELVVVGGVLGSGVLGERHCL
jgi:hypothetical protein